MWSSVDKVESNEVTRSQINYYYKFIDQRLVVNTFKALRVMLQLKTNISSMNTVN